MSRPHTGQLPVLVRGAQIICGAQQTSLSSAAKANRRRKPLLPVLADALVMSNGYINAVGHEKELVARIGTAYEVIDLHGLTLLPGFNDSHMHIILYGLDLMRADLSSATGVRSHETALDILRQWRDSNKESAWVQGVGYSNDSTMSGCDGLRKVDLDIAFPDQPVFIQHATRHGALVNEVALRKAGINMDTPDPPGGSILRDVHGVPTGMLLEHAVDLVAQVMPLPTKSEMVRAIFLASNEMVRRGITAASDMKTGWFSANREFEAYREAAASGVPLRMTLCPHALDFGEPNSLPHVSDFRSDFGPDGIGIGGVRIGPLKLFSDGAFSIRTAALKSAYADTAGVGTLLYETEALNAWVLAAQTKGWQIAVHAIGDRAIEAVLDALQLAQAVAPRWDARHRIEHAMLLDKNTIARMAKLGVVAVLQPEFVRRFGDGYRKALGDERAARLMPVASLAAAGVPISFSSDCPVVTGLPLEGIIAATKRCTPSGFVLGKNEVCSQEQALYYYTSGAAFSSFDEKNVGRIAPGLRADFVVLRNWNSTDTVLPEVIATIISGVIVYGELETYTTVRL